MITQRDGCPLSGASADTSRPPVAVLAIALPIAIAGHGPRANPRFTQRNGPFSIRLLIFGSVTELPPQ
jgi:hypothetical protein